MTRLELLTLAKRATYFAEQLPGMYLWYRVAIRLRMLASEAES